jgi:hypothetical protein
MSTRAPGCFAALTARTCVHSRAGAGARPVLSRQDCGLSRAAPHGTGTFTSGKDSHHAAKDHDVRICRPLVQQEWGAGRNATMSHDEIQGAYHQVIVLGQYIQGNLVWPELIEPVSAERARLSAG